jgi:hypothetical protein
MNKEGEESRNKQQREINRRHANNYILVGKVIWNTN